MANEFAEDIAEGPDPDIDPGPEETDRDIREAEWLLEDAESGNQGDWNLKDDD